MPKNSHKNTNEGSRDGYNRKGFSTANGGEGGQRGRQDRGKDSMQPYSGKGTLTFKQKGQKELIDFVSLNTRGIEGT